MREEIIREELCISKLLYIVLFIRIDSIDGTAAILDIGWTASAKGVLRRLGRIRRSIRNQSFGEIGIWALDAIAFDLWIGRN